MAVDKRQELTGKLRIIIRLIGFTGLLIAAVGLIYWNAFDDENALYVSMCAGGVALVGLLLELRSVFSLIGAGRGAFGSNVFLQVALAIVLLGGVNVFSFLYHSRIDCTTDGLFTIDSEIRDALGLLRGETTIVVYQRHTAFGNVEKADHYDSAAERKIVAKVKDLVDQFRDLSTKSGARFRILHLDIEDEEYEKKLKKLESDMPDLVKAINSAPESSIFIHTRIGAENDTRELVQRLAFHDIFQLDRQASKERKNLILNYQGEGPLARKILNVQQRKPKIGIGVIHKFFGVTEATDDYGMPGLRKTLKAHGFDYEDIILRKGWDQGELPVPSVRTFREDDYITYEKEVAALEKKITERKKEIEELTKDKKILDAGLKKVNEEFTLVIQGFLVRLTPMDIVKKWKKEGKSVETKPVDQEYLELFQEDTTAELTLATMRMKEEKARLKEAQSKLQDSAVEDVAALGRITDLKAKLKRILADCDMLLLPRVTLKDVSKGDTFPAFAHHLDEAQVAAIKDFMKAGKPVLFCFGPTNMIPNPGLMRFVPHFGPNLLEQALGDIGIHMPQQTIMFDAESNSFARVEGGVLVRPKDEVRLPPVSFAWKPGASYPKSWKRMKKTADRGTEHPIRTSLKITSRAFGEKQPILRLRHPRPVYYLPNGDDNKWEEAPVFMLTAEAAWNETDPFPSLDRVPQYKQPEPGDPNDGTYKQIRQGAFPIAVALETKLPKSWYTGEKNPERDKVRLIVIGQATVFQGEELTPMQEKLLLDTCNWLLGREDLLASASAQPQGFARVRLSAEEISIWHWGTFLGMPLLFAYFGLVMFTIRRMR